MGIKLGKGRLPSAKDDYEAAVEEEALAKEKALKAIENTKKKVESKPKRK